MKSKILFLTTALSGLLALQAAAQDETGELIKAGTENANILAKAYLNPFGKSLGTNLNNGWISSGKVLKPGRFEVRILASASLIPDDETTFDLGALGYNTSTGNVRLASNNNRTAPTVFGPNADGPQLDIYGKLPNSNEERKLASFNTPPGIGYNVSPFPMAQVSVGLFKETEIMIRYVPEKILTYEDGRANLWGIGLKHSLRQWIPVVSALPFDITVAAGYTNLKVNYGLNLDPQTQVSETTGPKPVVQSSVNFDNQELQLVTRSKYGSIVVSKTIAVITGYAGVSFSSAKTEFGAIGN